MAREGVVELYHQLYCTADRPLFQSSLSSFPTHQHRHTSMERTDKQENNIAAERPPRIRRLVSSGSEVEVLFVPYSIKSVASFGR